MHQRPRWPDLSAHSLQRPDDPVLRAGTLRQQTSRPQPGLHAKHHPLVDNDTSKSWLADWR
jgi:hypothetical protein